VMVRMTVLLILVLAACQAGPASPSSVPTVSGKASPTEQPSATEAPSAEPASGRIVFSRNDPAIDDSFVYLIDPNGTSERLLVPGAHECPRWSPDGKDISLGSGIFENAGQPNGIFRAFTTLEHTRYLPDPTLNLGCPIWSPDGSRLAYEGWDDADPTRNGIYTLNAADGSDLHRLTSNSNGGDLPGDYSADGTQLFFMRVSENHEQGPLMVVGTDGSDARLVTSNAYGAPSMSRDGQTLLASRSGSLYLIAVDGSLATPIEILNTTMDAYEPMWSPDGSWILFTLYADLSGGGDIARVRPDGTGLFQITHDPADEGAADWAP
jgi:Tol biopolymer transport system component